MVDSSDMRDFRRMSIDCGLTFKKPDSDTVYSGIAKNLSATGVLIECDEPLTIGDQLEINIKPEKTITDPLNAVVEVIRIGEGRKNHAYELACTITEMKS